MTKITYLYHSGFVIENETIAIVIDYWRDSINKDKGYLHSNILPSNKKLYVLASHFHPDHFNPDIFSWQETNQDIQYILSKDILRRRKLDKSVANFLVKGETFEDTNIFVKAYGSTDVGISFYIEFDGQKIFHAGDLNNWHWQDESTDEESEKSEKHYLGELKDICKDITRLDIAFFPIDNRIGSDYDRGARQFLENVPTGLLIPMHFTSGGFDTIKSFAAKAESRGAMFWTISKEGESI